MMVSVLKEEMSFNFLLEMSAIVIHHIFFSCLDEL
jgi:hypothetical protein